MVPKQNVLVCKEVLKGMEGRRHSVDIPISRTLIALRRVRSLRDPSTNSLSKFSPLVDHLNWETHSNRETFLGLENEPNSTKILELVDKRLDGVNNQGLCCNSRDFNSKVVSHEDTGNLGNIHSHSTRPNINIEGSKIGKQSQDVIYGNKSMSESERYYSSYRDKGLELACVTPCSDNLEEVGSCNEPNEGSIREQNMYQNTASNLKCQQRYRTRHAKASAGDVLSCVGSPCLELKEDFFGGLSRTPSIYGNEDIDILDSSQCGCGISRYWSRTPRHKESSINLDMEEQPLLTLSSGELNAKRSQNLASYGVKSYSESPRSISQKFRPKSFHDLVGQNVVSMSLLSAVSVGKITPLYLFHGPRGTGKTSAARIFAAALNCLSSGREKPCGQCRECVLFFSGRSRDFKELNAVEVNTTLRVRAIIKNAKHSPISSRFKVFIIDECHLLKEDTWAGFLNSLEDLSGHVVFIMITPDLHKLHRLALSRSQKYHFPKIKEVDISSRLEKICVEEGFSFDLDALEFIACKSSGSLRDAEMMLEQLSLIGKKITMSLARDLMGVVSDGELLDLLHLAMSSDTAETVKRARGLMRSRIDPLQLVSQLANLIMDILAGKSQQETSSENGRFVQNHSSEGEMQQLSQALKVLSETEKQLRQSNNQTTWLTVALLQLSSLGPSQYSQEPRLCNDLMQPREGEFCSTSSTNESVKHLLPHACDVNASSQMRMSDCKHTLESIWSRAASICESKSLRNFLRKRGTLLSISHSQGLAVTVLGFHHPKHVNKAEKSWKTITGALQHVLGHNVELQIHLVVEASLKDHAKSRKLSLRLFGCSRGIGRSSHPAAECQSDLSDKTDFTAGKASTTDKYVETCSSDCGSYSTHTCCQVIRAIRNRDGNVLSIRGGTPQCSLKDENCKGQRNCGCQDLFSLEPEKQPGCFSRTLKLEKFMASNTTEKNVQNNLALSVAHTASSQAFF